MKYFTDMKQVPNPDRLIGLDLLPVPVALRQDTVSTATLHRDFPRFLYLHLRVSAKQMAIPLPAGSFAA